MSLPIGIILWAAGGATHPDWALISLGKTTADWVCSARGANTDRAKDADELELLGPSNDAPLTKGGPPSLLG